MSILTNEERAEIGLPPRMNVTETLLTNLDREPCGCFACDAGVQQGHFACDMPRPVILQLEKEGYVSRSLSESSWRWLRTNKQLPSERTHQ